MGANLCISCYPGAGDPNVMCDSCFRQLRGQLEGDTSPYSARAVVDQLFWKCVPKRQHRDEHGEPTSVQHLLPELANIDPLVTGTLFTGPSGRGKSFATAVLFLRGMEFAAASGQPPISSEFQWVTVIGVLETLKASFGKKDDHPLVDLLKHARMLHLEDMGTTNLVDERKTDWAYGVLMDIVDFRHANMKPTNTTTNLTLPLLEEKVGARVVSRLVEDAVVLHIDGEQRRKPISAGAA